MPHKVSIVAITKGEERYVFVYDDIDRLRQIFRTYAEDPELSFNWFDAAVLMQRVRRFAGR